VNAVSNDRDPTARSWFRTRGGRRFGVEFGVIIVAKLILLSVLWHVAIKPQPRADTSPEAIERHFTPSTPNGPSP
jgi:hypothetical protein